jgi:cytochrome c-type biogenesis protein CcmF
MINPGYILLWFTTAVTALAMLAYLPGVRREAGRPLLKLARPAVYLTTAGLVASAGLLWYFILTHQYQYDYVFRYTSGDMPLRYVITAFWGGQEGTFLLWALFGGFLALFLRFKARQYEAPVMFFYLGINLFLMFMMLKASPFARLPVTPEQGNGLNPLLQDPWMTIHPPVMFFGFASLGIPAAYAMAALVKEDWDNWIRRAIPWTIFGVMALGTGLVLGGYWAYSILGWGGFWGWDPVENSSLVPWLLAIAMLHTQVTQQKRGLFKRTNLFLAMIPFVLLTYSTFLTRSGVLADFSVHSFTDLGINQFLVAFMTVFLGGGLLLFIYKFRRIPVSPIQAPFMSREYFMFLGALVFGLLGLFVLLGTSAPLYTRWFGPPANVQPDFYNRMGIPFAILIGLLIGCTPFLVWNKNDYSGFWQRVRWPGALAALSAPVLFLVGVRDPRYLLILVSAIFAVVANAQVIWTIMRRNRLAAGGYVTHLGIGLCLLGILTSTAYNSKDSVALPQGEEVMVLGYGFTYMGKRPVENGRKDAYDVALRTSQGMHVMSPTMFFSDFNRGMMKKPAIQSFLPRDVYISPIGAATDPLDDRIQTMHTLLKDQPATLGEMPARFLGFETTEGQHQGHNHDAQQIAARIEVETEEGPVVIEPVLVVLENGRTELEKVEIPGTGQHVSLLGVDEAAGRAQLGVTRAPIVLARGERAVVPEGSITLNGFDLDLPQREGGSVTVYASAHVEVAGENHHLKPGFVSRPGAEELELIEAPIGNTGLNLVLENVDANEGLAFFHIAPTPRSYLYAEISLKPFIILLWIGTVLMVVGLTMATLFRARLAGRLSKAGMGEASGRADVRKNGKRDAA